MAVTYMLIKADEHEPTIHVRSTYAKAEATDCPDWIAAIGSSGGIHSLETCELCAINSMARKVRDRFADMADDQAHDAETFAKNNDAALADYKAYDEEQLRSDYHRQNERYVKQAERCPARRLAALDRELDLLGEVAYKQAADTSLGPVQMSAALLRYFAIERGRAVVNDRLAKIETDDVERARLAMVALAT